MLVAKDLSDCISCPLRELTIKGELVVCEQYVEAAQAKLRAKLGITGPITVIPKDHDINDDLL